MQSIDVLNEHFFQVIDSLNYTDLKSLHKNFIDHDCYGKEVPEVDISNISQLKNIIKIGIQKIPADDLMTFAPLEIKRVFEEFQKKRIESSVLFGDGNVESISVEETQESLIKEAINITNQRISEYEEIPRDLQQRFGYITAKLNKKFKLTRRQISEALSVTTSTVSSYIDKTVANNPDLIKLWSESAEAKAVIGAEKTIAKKVTDTVIQDVTDTLELGSFLRNNYSIPALQKGFYLNLKEDMNRLVKQSVDLFLTHDDMYHQILEIDRKYQQLLAENKNLKESNQELINLINILI